MEWPVVADLWKGLRITFIVTNITKNLLYLSLEYIDFEASVSDEGTTLNFSSDDEKDDGNRY